MTDAINKIAAEKSINNRTDSKYLDRSSIAKASKSVPYYTYSFDNETNKTSIPVYVKQKSTNNALAAFMNRLVFGSKPIKLLKIKELPLEEPIDRGAESQRHSNEIIFRNQYTTIGANGMPFTSMDRLQSNDQVITNTQNTHKQIRDIDENKINQNIKTFIKNNCYKTIFNNITEQDSFSGGGGVEAPTTDKYKNKNETDNKEKRDNLKKVLDLDKNKKNQILDRIAAQKAEKGIDGDPAPGVIGPVEKPLSTEYWLKNTNSQHTINQEVSSSEGTDARANLVDMSKKMTSTDFPPDDLDNELLKFSDDATGVSFKKGKKGSLAFDYSKGRWRYIPSTPDTYETEGSRSIGTTPIPFRSTDK